MPDRPFPVMPDRALTVMPDLIGHLILLSVAGVTKTLDLRRYTF